LKSRKRLEKVLKKTGYVYSKLHRNPDFHFKYILWINVRQHLTSILIRWDQDEVSNQYQQNVCLALFSTEVWMWRFISIAHFCEIISLHVSQNSFGCRDFNIVPLHQTREDRKGFNYFHLLIGLGVLVSSFRVPMLYWKSIELWNQFSLKTLKKYWIWLKCTWSIEKVWKFQIQQFVY